MKKHATSLLIGGALITLTIVLYANRYKLIEANGTVTRVNRITLETKYLREGKWRTYKDFAYNTGVTPIPTENLPAEQIELIELSSLSVSGGTATLEVYNGSDFYVSSLAVEVSQTVGDSSEPRQRTLNMHANIASKSVQHLRIYVGSAQSAKTNDLRIVGAFGVKRSELKVNEKLASSSRR